MKTLLARVVLHEFKGETSIPEKDYETLHSAMFAIGFYKIIQDENTKKWYSLPPAEYICYSQKGVELACTSVQQAAMKTGRDFSVLVTEFEGARWAGLKEFKQNTKV